MSNNLFNNNNTNLKANKINNLGKGNNLNKKVEYYVGKTIAYLIIVILLIGLLLLCGFRIYKCSEKTKKINNDKIINNQSLTVNKKNNLTNDNKKSNTDSSNVNIANFNNSNVPITHREGLEERMKNPHLYKHGNPFQYREKVKKYYNDYN